MSILWHETKPGSLRGQRVCGLATVGLATALALFAVAAPRLAIAQDGGVTELAGIVIEGTTLAGDSVEAAAQGTAVSVVTAKDLEDRQVRTAVEALRSLPGVAVNRSNGPTGLTVVRLRGAEANHTLVLIDGIEANQTSDGAFDFAHLPADQIERIEVIRGPQSGLYGSNAIGGVINIITKSGAGPLRVSVRGEAGSFDTTDAGISVSGGSDALHAAVTYNERTTAGYNIAPEGSERDGGTRRAFTFKGGAKINDRVAFDASFRDVHIEGERDTDGLTGAFSVQADNPNFFASHVRLAHLGVKLDLLDGRWTHRARVTGNETRVEDTAFSSSPDGAFFATESDAYKYHYTTTMRLDGDAFGGTRHFLTGLVENEHERFTPVTQDNVQRGRERWSYAAEYRGEFWDALNLSATIRYDDSDSFDDFTTWRTSGSWRVPETGLRLHASAGTGIKYPTMFEQFGSLADFIPNPNLAVEESFGWDAGAEVTMLDERLVVDVTYFEADLTNEIETVFLAGPPCPEQPDGDPGFCSTVANREGDSERRGIEVQARAAVTPDLSLSAAYTWLDATEPDGSVEIRRPEHSGRVDLNYAFAEGRGKLHVSAAYNGEAEDDAFALSPSPFPSPFPSFTPTRVTLDDYWLVSLAASYKIRENIELFGRVENALDEDYQEVFGFETAGVAAYGGVRITLEDMTALADAGPQ